MSNEEYQALIRIRDGAELRRRLTDVADATERAGDPARGRRTSPTRNCARWSPISAVTTCRAARGARPRPTPSTDAPVGHLRLHHQRLRPADGRRSAQPLACCSPRTQMDELQANLGVPEDDDLGRVRCRIRRRATLRARNGARRSPRRRRVIAPPLARLDHPGQPAASAQADLDPGGAGPRAGAAGGVAGGRRAGRDAVAGCGDLDAPLGLDQQGRRLRAGSVARLRGGRAADAASGCRDRRGSHIELGISEMNLFMALGQFGLSYELTGQHLIPIGTVYDPFVCRGLDALIYGLYVGAKMIFAGTPAGVSLSPGRRRAPEHGHAVARDRAARASISTSRPSRTRSSGCCWKRMRRCCDREHGSRPTSGSRPSRSIRR